jgi:hypothetical protein
MQAITGNGNCLDNQAQHLHKVNSNQVAKRMFFIKAFEIVHIWEQIQFEDVFSSKVEECQMRSSKF